VGNRTRNPLNFQYFGLTEIAVYTDGHHQSIKPLKVDYANGQYVRAYNTMFSGIGKLFHDEGIDIIIVYYYAEAAVQYTQ